MRCILLLLALFLSTTNLLAQTSRPVMEFGMVSAGSFSPHIPGDSTPRAVYLFDKGVVTFEQGYSSSGGFSVVFKRHVRILILHKSALSLATVTLSRYRKSDATLQDVKGATYNLENGIVVPTDLDKTNIFKDKNTNYDLQKIAFPNVKEGSIIEYSYTFVFPNIGFVPPWTFQGSYPELWSEFDITVPRLFDYAVMMQGYQKFAIDTVVTYDANSPGINYGVTDRAFFANQTVRHVWAQADVPPLERIEPYTTTLKNHVSKIEFQLSAARRPNGYTETFSTTWPQVTHELLKNDHFGAGLDDHNRWLDDDMKKITAGSASPEEKLRRIYTYVRDHFTTPTLDRIYVSQPIKQTWQEKKAGCVADINLLLTAICKHEGLDASPVILSSRANGYAHDGYPLLSEYNYVITRVRIDGINYLLDASKPYLGFNQLPELCYNGYARAIDSTHDRIPLMADSVKESRRTLVVLSNTDSGFAGAYSRTAGVFESMALRNQLRHIHPEDFFDNIRKTLPGDKQMGAAAFDSLETPEVPVVWHYNMKYNFSQKRVYFNPILHERFNSSPFNTEERHYPVEMNYRIDNAYVLTMEIPKGYAVEQLPKPQRIMLSDSAGLFEYNISSDEHSISLRILLQLKKAVFPLDEYGGLRDFFSMISGKEKEPIIFKKTEP